MSEFGAVLRGLDWSMAVQALLSVLPALICITIHEVSHGAAAYLLGDDTAKRQGRLTLNPIRHIDPIGLLMMIVARFGWAKPVPVDARNFQNPKAGMAVTALAGPLSNFILAAVILIFQVPLSRLYGVGGASYYVAETVFTTAILSVYLGVFNLLPIPPLDGSKIVFSFLRDEHYNTLMRYERYGMFLLVILIWANVVSGPLNTAASAVLEFLADGTYRLSSFLFL